MQRGFASLVQFTDSHFMPLTMQHEHLRSGARTVVASVYSVVHVIHFYINVDS